MKHNIKKRNVQFPLKTDNLTRVHTNSLYDINQSYDEKLDTIITTTTIIIIFSESGMSKQHKVDIL